MGQHGDDLLGSFSWQRLWSKGFSALYLANAIASHENAKNLLLEHWMSRKRKQNF